MKRGSSEKRPRFFYGDDKNVEETSGTHHLQVKDFTGFLRLHEFDKKLQRIFFELAHIVPMERHVIPLFFFDQQYVPLEHQCPWPMLLTK